MLNNISSRIVRFCKDEEGATAVEYGLIATLIAIAIIATVRGLGNKLVSTFGNVRDNLK